jgi:hypothetical protein
MAGLAQPGARVSLLPPRVDLSGRPSPPPRWFMLLVAGALLLGLVAAAGLFGASSAPAASPSPAPATPVASPVAACPTALLGGTLVAHDLWGVAVQTDGPLVQVLWPSGYGVRTEGAVRVVLDERGQEVARTGDRVEIGGGFVGPRDGVWFACDGVSVVE